MTRKNKGKAMYLVTNAEERTPLISLYSLPTKCPICNSVNKPQPISFQYNYDDDAIVKFSCMNSNCKSFFSALYIKGRYENEQYHFICFNKFS